MVFASSSSSPPPSTPPQGGLYLPVWLQVLQYGMLTCGILLLVLYFKSLIILLSLVLVITYALNTPLAWLHSKASGVLPKNWPHRGLALVLLLVVVLGCLIPAGISLWHIVYDEAMVLKADLPRLLAPFGFKPAGLLPENLKNLALNTGELLSHGLLHALHSVAAAILVLYLLLDGPKLRQQVMDALPQHHRVFNWCLRGHDVLKAYVAEQLLVSLFSGLVMTGVYSLLGFKYPVLLGVFNGVCSSFPVAGPWLGLIPGLLLALLGSQPVDFGWLLLWAGGLYLFKEYILLPKLIGNTLEIHPLLVIVAFLGCFSLFGLLGGLCLALPLASFLSVWGEGLRPAHSKAMDL